MTLYNAVFFYFHFFVGFKATMIYERCLEERNSIIASQAFSSLELSSPSSEGTAFNMGMNGTQIMPAIPECDLQKELDNVNTGSH
jgi:hypothetical protein